MKSLKTVAAGCLLVFLGAARPSHPRTLSVSFEKNQGQAPSDVRFLARGSGYTLAFTQQGSRIDLRRAGKHLSFNTSFTGANPNPSVRGDEKQFAFVNYFRGRESFTDIPTFGRVRYEKVYRGIDVTYYGTQRELEYDFTVMPEADPAVIALHFEGADHLTIDSRGDLLVGIHGSTVTQRAPVVYQEHRGVRKSIHAEFRLISADTVGFAIGPYDRHIALTIDPILSYSTFLGGNGDDDARAIATDSAGNVYIAGLTTSTNFPTMGPAQANPGSSGPTNVTSDAFVTKLNASGTALLYSTYLGGADDDAANAIALDAGGNVIVTGWTTSTSDFPTTGGAIRRSCNAGSTGSCLDAFVAKLNPAGSALVYSTYLGGTGDDQARGLAVDSSGAAYVTGTTSSTDFQTTTGAFSTDPTTGGFVTKLSTSGAVVYSSYFGAGSGTTVPNGIAVDSAGNAYLTGATPSSTTTGTDVFLTKLNAGGTAAVYTQYIRGGKDDAGNAITVDASGNAYVSGQTLSLDFTTTSGVVQPGFGGGPAFRSADAGSTWTISSAGLKRGSLYALAVAPSAPLTIYAGADDQNAGDVYKSTDGGNNWSVVSSGLTDARVHALAVDPSAPSTVYAGTRTSGVFKSTNGGTNWSATSLQSAFVTALAVDSTTPTTVYAGTDSSGFFKSSDGGATWSGPNASLPNSSIRSIVIDPSTPATLYVATSTGVYKSTDAGSSWVSANSGIFDENVNAVVINPKNPASLFAATSSFGIFRSLNRGLFWISSNSGLPTFTDGVFVSALTIDPGTGTLYAAVGQSNVSTIYKSADGITWTPAGLASTRVSSIAMSGSTILAATTGGTEAFVARWNASGALVYSTYLGAYRDDAANAITVDSSGNVLIAGTTSSANFPVANAVQPAFGGGSDVVTDAFAAKLNPSATSVLWATYLGGSSDDSGKGIALDANGNAYVVGQTASIDFPVVSALIASRPGLLNGFIARISDSSSIGFTFAARGGMITTSQGGTSTVSQGHVRIQSNGGGFAPSGIAIFGYRQNNILVTEAAVPASGLISSGRIYAEVSGSVNTGVAMANPNNQPVTINFHFTDSQGADFGQGTTVIPANAQIATFLNQAPFNGGASVIGTFSFTASSPISVIALRGLTNERSEFLITTLPVADLSATANSNTIFFPHFANGGGWTTQILLVNTSDSAMSGTIQFYGQGSSTAAGQLLGTPINYTLPPRGSFGFAPASFASTLTTGSFRVVPAAGSNAPSGVAVFSFQNAGVTVSTAGVPSVSISNAFRLYAELSGTPGRTGSIQTGVAIANPSSSPAQVVFELNTLSGTSTGLTGSMTVPASGQVAVFLSQIPGLTSLSSPFQGVLRVSTAATGGISVVGIRGRYNERGDFLLTTTAPTDESHPPTGEQFFPHFADGGGYTTQFILFNGGPDQTSSGTLRFLAQSGQSISLALR